MRVADVRTSRAITRMDFMVETYFLHRPCKFFHLPSFIVSTTGCKATTLACSPSVSDRLAFSRRIFLQFQSLWEGLRTFWGKAHHTFWELVSQVFAIPCKNGSTRARNNHERRKGKGFHSTSFWILELVNLDFRKSCFRSKWGASFFCISSYIFCIAKFFG